MATRFTDQATQSLNPVYSGAEASIQAQMPAISQLYQGLVAALQQGATAGQQGVLDSAAQRGVGRAGLAGEVQGAIQGELNPAIAGLTRAQAGQEAAMQGSLTELGQGRVSAIAGLAGSLQDQDIMNQRHNMAMQDLQRSFDLDVERKRLRDIEKAKAEARARASSSANSKPSLAQIRSMLNSVKGKDGKVNPRDYQEALALWGGDAKIFHNEMGGFINRSHVEDYMVPIMQGRTMSDIKKLMNPFTAPQVLRR